MDKPLTADDKFLNNMRNKHNTKEKDKEKLGVRKTTMEGVLEGILQVPEKLHMVGSPETASAKPAKPEENPLHTGSGKDFSKSTMDK